MDSRQDTDHDLMQRVAAGDKAAFRLLVARHLDFCVRFAERMTGSRHDAEDIAQEVCLRVWKEAAKWRPEAKFTTWLYRVMTNACIDHKRRRRALPLLGEEEAIPDDAPGPEMTLQTRQRAARVKTALAQLPERQRAALVLGYYEELTNEQAAAAMGIAVNAYQQLLYRARQGMKAQLKDDLTEQGNG